MKILIKFPSRSRPDKFITCLANMFSLALKPKELNVIATIDEDDTEKEKYIQSVFPITYIFGQSKNKIHAYNRDIPDTEWDILIAMSDDMLFQVHEWDDIIRQDMRLYFPDTDGVLHYNDGNQGRNVMTMSIVGRKYYERFKYIYHPDYSNLWCDAEATEVARILKKYKYMSDEKIIFRHLHPAFGLSQYDEQYRKSESPESWQRDEDVYRKRKANNFGL